MNLLLYTLQQPLAIIFQRKPVPSLLIAFRSGGGGIRTPGTFQYAGFQDQCIRPLCHPSEVPVHPVLNEIVHSSGEGGIRTHDELLTHTPLAGERLQPLGHLSQGYKLGIYKLMNPLLTRLLR